jgi:two-component system OmpR family response regulator
MRVLIVEDEPKMASLIRRGLADEGMAADVALSGEAALPLAEAKSYDVVIVDLMLPGIDGLETARRLRSAGHAAALLLITAGELVEERMLAPHGHADDYLRKPFPFDELVLRVRALAGRLPGR